MPAGAPPPPDRATLAEPAPGDLVVICASDGPSAEDGSSGPARWAVIEWGGSVLEGVSVPQLERAEARAHARMLASTRGRRAWESAESGLIRLPHVPLVYLGPVGTYTITADETDYGRAGSPACWRSVAGLADDQARQYLASLGFQAPHASVLLASPSRSARQRA